MENDNALNVQNGFFNQARKDRAPVTILLTNGERVTGTVKAFDRFTLLLDADGVEQIVFKHAISTVAPVAQDRPEGKP